MAKVKDLTGRQFGRLTVLGQSPEPYVSKEGIKWPQWICKCSCGNETVVRGASLVSGNTRSCGCLRKERARASVDSEKENLLGHFDGTSISRIKIGKPANKNSESGTLGVYPYKRTHKWIASICFKGKNIYLGSFDTIEEAARARKAAEKKYFQPTIERYEELKENEKDH